MRKLLAKELKDKFSEILNDIEDCSYDEGNPFLIRIAAQKYYVFIKNLSSAYFAGSPDITRIQLPSSDQFAVILKSDIPFIALGYDVDNDTVVSWNPIKLKERLNTRHNVSLYARESLQSNLDHEEFKAGYLSNGEKFVVFRRTNLSGFFTRCNSLFDEKIIFDKKSESSDILIPYGEDKLHALNNHVLLQGIKPLLMKNQVLEAVRICCRFYKGKYNDMSFRDWFRLVEKEYKKLHSE